MTGVRTSLWFEKAGEEAATFYVSLLPDSRIDSVFRPEPEKPALAVNFTIAGVPYQIINGGSYFRLSPAASISVTTADQAETDRLWNALTAEGGEESMCGWLVDRFGLSWQIVPARLIELLGHPDTATAGRAREAMLTMRRIDIAALESAALS